MTGAPAHLARQIADVFGKRRSTRTVRGCRLESFGVSELPGRATRGGVHAPPQAFGGIAADADAGGDGGASTELLEKLAAQQVCQQPVLISQTDT